MPCDPVLRSFLTRESTMRPRTVLATMLAALLVVAAGAGRSPRDNDDKLDKKALDIVKQAASLYKDAKSLQTTFSIEAAAVRDGEKQNVTQEVTCAVERPNKIALHSHPKGDKDKGLDVVCD